MFYFVWLLPYLEMSFAQWLDNTICDPKSRNKFKNYLTGVKFFAFDCFCNVVQTLSLCSDELH